MKKSIFRTVFVTCFLFLFFISCGQSQDSDSNLDTGSDTNSDADTDTNEREIPLDSFEATDCLGPMNYREPTVSEVIDDGYGDLECLVWQKKQDDQLELTILGYKPSLCSELDKPLIIQKGSNNLIIKMDFVDEDCTCCYALNLTIQQSFFDEDITIILTEPLLDDIGNAEVWSTILPITKKNQGTICRYPKDDHPHCGETPGLHSACGKKEYDWTCPKDLECVQPMNGRTQICMKPCLNVDPENETAC